MHVDSVESMTELILIANAGDGTISTLRLHREPEPRLEAIATSGELDGCGTFAVDADRDLVFAAYKGDPPGIATLSLDRSSGELQELARCDADDSLTYLALANHGRTLLGASYGGGFGAAWPVEGSSLGEPRSQFGYGNVHCIIAADVPGGDNTAVYAVSLGDDLVAQFSLDSDGHLTPLDPAVVPAPEHSGPRHMVVDGANAYLVTEFSGELIRLGILEGGSLERAESVDVVNPEAGLEHSELDADPKERPLIWGADVHVAGDYVLTSERNTSQLTSVRRHAQGRLGEVVGFADTEKTPRGFNVTSDGRFVIAVGEDSTHAQLLEVGADGELEQRDRVEIGRGANWVRIIDDA